MNKLKKYVKPDKEEEKEKPVVTSVTISKDQKKYVDDNNLNLSLITRDAIDELREQDDKETDI